MEMKKFKLKDRKIKIELEVCNPDNKFFSDFLKMEN